MRLFQPWWLSGGSELSLVLLFRPFWNGTLRWISCLLAFILPTYSSSSHPTPSPTSTATPPHTPSTTAPFHLFPSFFSWFLRASHEFWECALLPRLFAFVPFWSNRRPTFCVLRVSVSVGFPFFLATFWQTIRALLFSQIWICWPLWPWLKSPM